MALALLSPSRVPGPPGTVAFQVDIGTNRFYQFAIGDDTVVKDHGFPLLGEPSYRSPLLGPLPEHARGRTVLEIPVDRFDREHRSIQLTSYRNPERHAPAVSDIVRVPVVSRVAEDLPPIAFSMRHEMETYPVEHARAAPWRYAEPMCYREVPPMSSAMFLSRLGSVIKTVVSKVAPVVSGLLKKVPEAAPIAGAVAAPGVGAVAGGPLGAIGSLLGAKAGEVIQGLLKPDTVKLLTDLLEQLKQPAVAQQPTPEQTQQTTAKALAMNRRYVEAAEYSHAAVAPALLAALPALMPLLEKVLTPETIKAVLDTANPTKVIGAVTDSVKEIGKLGLDFDKQSNEHLRALNPMGVHAPVDDLLKGMGLAQSFSHGVVREKGEPAYRRVESVVLNFAGASPVAIHGRSRVCYRHGEEIAFALDVTTPRTIGEATVTVLVKDPETRKIITRKAFAVQAVSTGRLPKRIALGAAETKAMKAGEEYLVCVYLTWKNSKGKVIGTSRTQMITLIGEYVFDRVEDGQVVPLNDVAKHRPFWHKVWQGTFAKDAFKYDFEGKYYYVLEPDRTANAPIETVVAFQKGESQVRKGRLKSGFTCSLGSLNALVPQISNGKPLTESQLSALSSSDFVSRFNTAARFSAALSGKAGVSAAIWIYPEVKLHEVVLFKAASTDADSHVRELTEEKVRFPIPVSIHVIGARTT